MVQDKTISQAVAAIPQRSERQQDLQKLVGSFVDVGILPQIRNVNNQIIFGRRGTGKTHILRVLADELSKGALNDIALYIDARTLGSTSQFSDTTIPLPARCLALFRDVLGEIYNALLESIVRANPDNSNQLLDLLNDLSMLITEPITTYSPETHTVREATKDEEKAGLRVGSGPKVGLEVVIDSEGQRSNENEKTTSYAVRSEDKVIFPALSSSLRKILQGCTSKMYVLVDEWSSLPVDVQPFLAEFFKRGLLPLPEVVVKIASLEYKSVFSTAAESGGVIGFEVGADISASIDIDDYYVYDRNPTRITEAFADMLYKHVQTELPDGYLAGPGIQVTDGEGFTRKLFSDRSAFQELVRSSEGVARDLINIFNHAYFSAHRRGKEKIDKSSVTEAARLWYEQDKLRNLDQQLQELLQRIIEQVIGEKKARSFLLAREFGNHPLIQKLFDLRVLHVVQRGYADKDKPGVRYDIYTLDYGTYVDLMNTSKKPDVGFAELATGAGEDFLVPFDDKRSIRRIILDPSILEFKAQLKLPSPFS